jgi:hypothetical protein
MKFCGTNGTWREVVAGVEGESMIEATMRGPGSDLGRCRAKAVKVDVYETTDGVTHVHVEMPGGTCVALEFAPQAAPRLRRALAEPDAP